MRAANKKFIWALGALFALFAFAPISTHAQSYGGSASSTLFTGASGTAAFQSPGGAQQNAAINAQGSSASALLTQNTKVLVVTGAPTTETSDTSYMIDSNSREVILISAFGALFALGVLFVLSRQIRNSY